MLVSDKNFLRFAVAFFYFIFIVLFLIVGLSIYDYIIGKEKLGANAEITIIAILTLFIIRKEIQLTKEGIEKRKNK